MLYPIIHDAVGNAYCGPTAIASITQTPISKIRKMVRRLRNDHKRKMGWGRMVTPRKQAIKGMYPEETRDIMRRLGYKCVERNVRNFDKKSITLAQFLDDYGHTGPFIVMVTGHFIAVSHGMICDTYTKGIPVPFAECKYSLRSRVIEYQRYKA